MKSSKPVIVRVICSTFLCLFLSSFILPHPENSVSNNKENKITAAKLPLNLYDSLKLDHFGLTKPAYCAAITGFESLRSTGLLLNNRILSIVDFSLPSSKKRLFIIDMEDGKLLFNTFVAHGRNSGRDVATKFSNRAHSFQSSLGFYVTGETYHGQHGYSLRLLGLEKGINDNALNRGIVMHAAPYVNEISAEKRGCIGRSEGCPAIPVDIHRPVIETIKNGTCLFVYGTDKKYLAHSKYL
jgi:hypothetical protein